MLHSAEARWFFHGNVDTDIERWITTGSLSSDQGARTDKYIVLPGCRSAGVKFREGNFEVKASTSARRDFALGDDIAGQRETWVKWSRPSADAAVEPAAMRGDEQWAFVHKRRMLRLFSLDGAAVREAAFGGPWLAAGCQVERTVASVILRGAREGPPLEDDWANAAAWWTFGFEAFGDPDEIERHLDRMLDYFRTDAPCVRLPLEASMSYPAWLAALTADA